MLLPAGGRLAAGLRVVVVLGNLRLGKQAGGLKVLSPRRVGKKRRKEKKKKKGKGRH